MRVLLVLVLALHAACPSPVSAGRLERVGEAAREDGSGRGGRTPRAPKPPRPQRSRVDRAAVAADLAARALSSLVESGRGRRAGEGGAGRSAGRGRTRERARRDQREPGPQMELAMEAGFFTAGMMATNLDLVAGRPFGFGLHARQAVLLEPYADGTRSASMGSYHLALFPRADRRVSPMLGLGARTWVDGVGTVAGVDGLLGTDFFLARRGMGRLSVQLGSLGAAFVVESRATLGYRRRRYEVFGGFSHTHVVDRADPAAEPVSLGGALAGVRVFR